MKYPELLFICVILFQYYSLQQILKLPEDSILGILLAISAGGISGTISACFILWGLRNARKDR